MGLLAMALADIFLHKIGSGTRPYMTSVQAVWQLAVFTVFTSGHPPPSQMVASMIGSLLHKSIFFQQLDANFLGKGSWYQVVNVSFQPRLYYTGATFCALTLRISCAHGHTRQLLQQRKPRTTAADLDKWTV